MFHVEHSELHPIGLARTFHVERIFRLGAEQRSAKRHRAFSSSADWKLAVWKRSTWNTAEEFVCWPDGSLHANHLAAPPFAVAIALCSTWNTLRATYSLWAAFHEGGPL